MMKKKELYQLDWTYDDVRDTDFKRHISQRENITQKNIISWNDYITDDILCEGAFENEIADLFHSLPICLGMVEMRLCDDEFFQATKKLIDNYKSGKYDPYIEDDDRPLLDKDIETVENYMKEQKI